MFLSKHSNGVYYIIFEKMNGKRGSKTTKEKLKTKALKKLGEFQARYEIEKNQKVIPIRLKHFNFNFLRTSEPYYTENTIKVYKSTFNSVLKHFGDIGITELTTQQIEAYLFKRIRETSVFAARKDLSNLSCAFNRAVRDGYLLTNPCKGIKRFRLPEKQPLFYSKEDYNKLIETIDNEDIKDITIVAINTGMRQGELITLEWNNINFDQEIITLDNRNHVTKTKRMRTIPMNNHVKEVLSKRLLNKNGSEHNYIFTLNKEPIAQKYFSKNFKKYVIKAKINPKLHFHSLRHTHASWLVQKGVSIYVVSRLLGHSTVQTTEIYSHLRRDDLKFATDILDKEFNQDNRGDGVI